MTETLLKSHSGNAIDESIAKKEDLTAAFLDAIDDDIGVNHSSNRFLENTEVTMKSRRERRLLGSLCILNGISSASTASRALSDLFSSIVESKLKAQEETNVHTSVGMLECARDGE